MKYWTHGLTSFDFFPVYLGGCTPDEVPSYLKRYFYLTYTRYMRVANAPCVIVGTLPWGRCSDCQVEWDSHVIIDVFDPVKSAWVPMRKACRDVLRCTLKQEVLGDFIPRFAVATNPPGIEQVKEVLSDWHLFPPQLVLPDKFDEETAEEVAKDLVREEIQGRRGRKISVSNRDSLSLMEWDLDELLERERRVEEILDTPELKKFIRECMGIE